MDSPVQLITNELFAKLAQQAAGTARRRLNHNFHSGPEDNPHRFLNVLLRGTYVRPHRHLDPPKSETFLVLEGKAAVLVFDDSGRVTAKYLLSAGPGGSRGIDLGPGLWHTIVALTEVVVCFEVKPGPWIPATDKAFAPWAPAEDSPEVAAYVARLENLATP